MHRFARNGAYFIIIYNILIEKKPIFHYNIIAFVKVGFCKAKTSLGFAPEAKLSPQAKYFTDGPEVHPMPRFFVSEENIDEEGRVASVLGEDAFHIARSLRMAVGDPITVCDGKGRDYECTLTKIRDNEVTAQIVSDRDCPAEPPYKATVYQALVKGDRLDTVIQKSVEFGACEIAPFESSRCIVRLKNEKEGAKSARRRRIALEAAKQCGRGIIPEVKDPIAYKSMLGEAAKSDLAIFCYEKEGERMLGAALEGLKNDPPKTVSVIVGPEGGFSPEEAEAAEKAGLCVFGLGKRILRTESAAAFVLACLSSEFELR